MKQTTAGIHNCLQRCLLVFKPDTLLKWYREWVKRKWTFRRRKQGGRPRIDPELEALVVRIAQETTHWGCNRIHGELVKLGFVLDYKDSAECAQAQWHPTGAITQTQHMARLLAPLQRTVTGL